MKRNQFSNNKLFFYPDRLKQVMTGKTANPVVYELSLSGRCNCACNYCCCQNFHSDAMLTREQIDQLVSELAANRGKAVTLTGGGEPMMNPDFAYCIRRLADNHISVGVITNGLLLDDDKIDAIAQHTSFCRISLDTADERQYKYLRGTPLNRASLASHLKKLVNKRDLYTSKLLAGAQIVYCSQTDEDIEETISFCKECRLDFLQIRPVDNITGEHLTPQYEFYKSKREFLNRMRTHYSTDKFSVIINENKFEEYDTYSVGKDYPHCLGGNFTAAIGHDMQVYFCCANIGNPALAIGDLKTASLRDILTSPKRSSLIAHPKWAFCQQQCRNHKMNKILQELMQMPREQAEDIIQQKQNEPRPLHCEFL